MCKRLAQSRAFEIYVKSIAEFDTTSYQSAIVALSCRLSFSSQLTSKNSVTLKFRLGSTPEHWKWHHRSHTVSCSSSIVWIYLVRIKRLFIHLCVYQTPEEDGWQCFRAVFFTTELELQYGEILRKEFNCSTAVERNVVTSG